MGRRRKLFDSILSGSSDANIPFDGARALLLHLGFKERTKGKHQHKFYREGVEELLNLQDVKGMCKPYQVAQMRKVLLKYNMRERL